MSASFSSSSSVRVVLFQKSEPPSQEISKEPSRMEPPNFWPGVTFTSTSTTSPPSSIVSASFSEGKFRIAEMISMVSSVSGSEIFSPSLTLAGSAPPGDEPELELDDDSVEADGDDSVDADGAVEGSSPPVEGSLDGPSLAGPPVVSESPDPEHPAINSASPRPEVVSIVRRAVNLLIMHLSCCP